ncbi:hypothetical protein AD006_30035 (plasmid) [Pseudonocardia sp. EC080610-09]|nr:hypothetical protein AD006_30035 [Pseudonocardia sp. EC080610-09]ALL85562.1 hypothetical protein AD017_31215 [Pseudonocardia sp. EC080619-01]
MVDPFPASLRPAEAPTEQIAPIRWVPIDHPVTIEPWMLDASPRRTLLTAGSISSDYYDVDLIRSTAAALDGSTSEILVACPPEAAERLRGVHGITRAGQLPFKLLAPTLDLIVHHGGGLTALTALGAGVPQVILPLESKNADSAHRMCAAGAGVALPSSDASLADIGEVCRTLLEDRLARDRCRALATEMVAMPLPADVAGSLADRFVDVRSS